MRYKAVVAYDGSTFCGWQTQKRKDSIQEAIEEALSRMHGHPIEIVGSGRTDAKVHAIGQVFHFDSNLEIEEERMQAGMNANLNDKICIKKVEKVDDDFHARFDCVSKRYDYYLTKEVCNPFIINYMDVDAFDFDIVLMKEAAKVFLGTHDFTSFTSTRIDQRKNKVKTITKIEVKEEDEKIHFIFEGNGFLRYMVRMMVQTILMVGKKKILVSDVREMLEGKNKHLCNYKAKPNGLYLVEVRYK